MNDTEFNLLDKPWIRVIDGDCNVTEVSLTEALVNAHKFKSLKGELPTQDIAVLRLMLAVLHTVFSRFDENGEECRLEDDDEDAAAERWENLWSMKKLPEEPIRKYLEKWHNRFWLFHPERPFGQSAGLKQGTSYDAPKLNGEISESSNKKRLFSSLTGTAKNSLTYAQAARWLLYLNSYDDTSSKPTKEGKTAAGGSLPSPGVGWLGKLGLIYLEGDNLFETLLLNLVMINNGQIEADEHPLWEKDTVSCSERTEISMPDNLAELYTLQSRRIFLNREDGEVNGYLLLGGDFFKKENAFSEPMTVWRNPKEKDPVQEHTPKRHNPSRQMWRDFASLYKETGNRRAGIIIWYENHLSAAVRKRFLRTVITGVYYGDKDFFVKNVLSDSLSMDSGFLSKLGRSWIDDIEAQVRNCCSLASAVNVFAKELYIASGGSKNDWESSGNAAEEQLYYRLDIPFRDWLRSIDTEKLDGRSEKISEWYGTAKKITVSLAEEMAEQAGEQAVIGHTVTDKNKKKEHYSAARSMIKLRAKINKIYETK